VPSIILPGIILPGIILPGILPGIILPGTGTAAGRRRAPPPISGSLPSAEAGVPQPRLIADGYRRHETVPIRNDSSSRHITDNKCISPLCGGPSDDRGSLLPAGGR
jgi:hypothetical protein